MTAIISTTYDDKYLFFLPIITWCWDKIGVDVICFMPAMKFNGEQDRLDLIAETMAGNNLKATQYSFCCHEHKDATYAQCSRLYAACLDIPDEEILITSDIDMAVFGDYLKTKIADFDIFGSDLTPEKQIPICYISASALNWRVAMGITKGYQDELDGLLGGIDAENFRGNYWSKDQETAYNKISSSPLVINHHFRARQGTQFASKRIDRDDAFWEDRLTPDIIDAHLWRPGYSEENFPKIIKLLHYFYPNENLQWMWDYREMYIKLL